MKKRCVLPLILCVAISLSGCSTAWVTTLDSILAAAAPALINILQIVALAKNDPVNSALESKINADASALKSLATDFAAASAAAAPGVCSQLQAAITTYQADEQEVLSVAQVSDSATQQKILALSGLVAGTIEAILAVVPNCQAATTPVTAARFTKAPPLPLKAFVSAYNAELVKPTGNAAVDGFTKKRKVHEHNAFVRFMSAGRMQ